MNELSTIRRKPGYVTCYGVTAIVFSVGCSGSSDNGNSSTSVGGNTAISSNASGGTSTNQTTSAANGGSSQSTGGTASTGGTNANGGSVSSSSTTTTATTGGTTASGGSQAAGGTTNAGGTKAVGGTTSTGGSKATGGTTSTGGSSACVAAGITKNSEATIATNGLTTVSYEGYLNGESFQQEGIITYNGYQYTAYWNNASPRRVVLARRALTSPLGAWQTIEFTDYTPNDADAHNTISIGISPGDGVLHLSFDHHSHDLRYRKSTVDVLTDPANVSWTSASFSTVQNQLTGSTVKEVTYPRFVTEPGGTKMLFSARIGTSGSGDEHLWEYDSTTGKWTSLGMYLNGNVSSTSTVNAYLHGLSYTKNGTRLHASWCWRETASAYTNHDLFYVYSDDHGRTWKNSSDKQVGTTGSAYITTSSDAKVYTIAQGRGLINQEHMAVDALGRVHVLLSHMPDGTTASATDFTAERAKSQYFHYMRDTNGTWSVRNIAATPVQRNFRGKLAISITNNVYAVLPSPLTTTSSTTDAQMVLAGASSCNNFAWSVLSTDSSRSYFSDPLVDASRLTSGNELTIVNQIEKSGSIWGLEYTLK